MSEMMPCLGCGNYIPELLIENGKPNFRCEKCGCETRLQKTLDEAERLWNEGRIIPKSEAEYQKYIANRKKVKHNDP